MQCDMEWKIKGITIKDGKTADWIRTNGCSQYSSGNLEKKWSWAGHELHRTDNRWSVYQGMKSTAKDGRKLGGMRKFENRHKMESVHARQGQVEMIGEGLHLAVG